MPRCYFCVIAATTEVFLRLRQKTVLSDTLLRLMAFNTPNYIQTMFEDILTTDGIPSTLAKPIKFKTPVKIKNLKTNSINTLAPGDFLISGAEQDVHSIVTAKSLKTLGANGAIEIGSSSKINKIDLNKDVAKIASANNFDAKVEFKTIAVKREIYTSGNKGKLGRLKKAVVLHDSFQLEVTVVIRDHSNIT